ncbi:MAG: hypothetical protein WD063_12120 [Pirellulales bacterium]
MDWISPRVWAGIPGCAAFLLLLGRPLVAADPPTGDKPRERAEVRVARLIKDLGARDFPTRSGAHQQLSKLGPHSRGQLEKALEDPDPEIRLRAGQLLAQLKLDELWAPSRVSIRATGETASKILLALAEQSGNHIHVGDPYGTFAEGKIDADYADVGYWEAVDDICRRTGNRLRPHYDMHTPGVVVSAGSPGNYPLAYAGPVRAQITSAKRQFIEELNYEENKSELAHSFHVNVQFSWEDRFRIVGYATQPELVEGVTDNQAIISAAQPSGSGWNATSRGLRQVTATLKLNPIPVSATSLAVFTIRWGLVAVGEPATLEISELEPGQVHSQDDVAVRIESIEKQSAGKYLVTLLVLRDLAMPDPYEIVFREYEAELVDRQDQVFRVQNFTPALTERGVQLRITFHGESAESEPKLLKLHYPRLRARRDVRLTFRNVPLPVGRPE